MRKNGLRLVWLLAASLLVTLSVVLLSNGQQKRSLAGNQRATTSTELRPGQGDPLRTPPTEPSVTGTKHTQVLVFVKAAGEVLPGARVTLAGPEHQPVARETSTTDKNGQVLFPFIAPGHYRILVDHPEYAAVSLDFEPIEQQSTQVIELERGSKIHGRVTDEHNRPLENVTLDVSRLSVVETLREARSNGEGVFLLAGLPVGEALLLRANLPKYRLTKLELFPEKHGESIERSIVMRQGLSVSGRIVDAAGQPVPNALVGASDLDAETAKSSDDGSFELQGLGNDSINLFAQAKGYATRIRHQVHPGTTGLTVSLERPGAVTGSVAVPATVGHLLVSACHYDAQFKKEICVARQVIRPPTDRYRLDGLPPGKYDLVVEAEGYPPRRIAFAVEAGEALSGPKLDPLANPGP